MQSRRRITTLQSRGSQSHRIAAWSANMRQSLASSRKRRSKRSSGAARASGILLVAALGSAAGSALAIDGPSVVAIPNANWGGVSDTWPYVVRLELGGGRWCSGTLIAPDLVATAGHCFGALGSNAAIPAGTVSINFGPNATTPILQNSGGRTHNVIPKGPNDFAVVSIDVGGNPSPTSPIPILPRPPQAGDSTFGVGFGVAFEGIGIPSPNQNQNNAQRIAVTVGGYSQHTEAAKNVAAITVDAVTSLNMGTAGFVNQFQQKPESWTEQGDSGGPGIFPVRGLPRSVYGSQVGTYARGDFVGSAVSDGPTPGTLDSSNLAAINYPPNPAIDPDSWTRLDTELAFIAANATPSMRPTRIQMFENLPADPRSLPADQAVGVFIRATYDRALTSDFSLNTVLWEEDNQLFGPYAFSGDVRLGYTPFADDLGGLGFSSGRFRDKNADLVQWAFTTAGALAGFDESLNPGDPPLDWLVQFNYGDVFTVPGVSAFGVGPVDLHFLLTGIMVDIIPTSFDQILAQISVARRELSRNAAERGGLALAVPEPGTWQLLLVAVIGMMLCAPRARWSAYRLPLPRPLCADTRVG